MPDTYDVVIVGGAAMGSSIAYHLLADPGFAAGCVVIEKDPTYRSSASALSAASIRQQFSTAVNIRISLFGIALPAPDRRAPRGRRRAAGDRPARRAAISISRATRAPRCCGESCPADGEGADIALLDASGAHGPLPLAERRTTSLPAPGAGPARAGSTAGGCCRRSAARPARSAPNMSTGEVAALERDGRQRHRGPPCGRHADRLRRGRRIAPVPGGRALAAHGRRRHPGAAPSAATVFTFACRERLEDCPLAHRHLAASMCGRRARASSAAPRRPRPTDPDWHDDDPASQEVDWSFFEEWIWPALAHRVPAFEAIRPGRAWAGPYDMNLLDHNAIVGPASRSRISISATASPATACSNRRPSAAASPSSSSHGRYTQPRPVRPRLRARPRQPAASRAKRHLSRRR